MTIQYVLTRRLCTNNEKRSLRMELDSASLFRPTLSKTSSTVEYTVCPHFFSFFFLFFIKKNVCFLSVQSCWVHVSINKQVSDALLPMVTSSKRSVIVCTHHVRAETHLYPLKSCSHGGWNLYCDLCGTHFFFYLNGWKNVLRTASTSRCSLEFILSVNHIQHHAAGQVIFALTNHFFQNQ